MKQQHNTKYTIPLLIVGFIAVIGFFVIDDMFVHAILFTLTTLLMFLNYKEARKLNGSEEFKWQMIISFVAFIIFLITTLLNIYYYVLK